MEIASKYQACGYLSSGSKHFGAGIYLLAGAYIAEGLLIIGLGELVAGFDSGVLGAVSRIHFDKANGCRIQSDVTDARRRCK